jgi:hypothetical protein
LSKDRCFVCTVPKSFFTNVYIAIAINTIKMMGFNVFTLMKLTTFAPKKEANPAQIEITISNL